MYIVMKQVSKNFNMFIVNDQAFTGYSEMALDLVYVIAILLGTFVIISKNPIISVLFLIGLFLSISCYLVLIGLNFIGLPHTLLHNYIVIDLIL